MQVLTALRWDNAAGVIERYQPKGWRNHPVVLMWRGYEAALGEYQAAVCSVWVARGFNDTCATKTAGLLAEACISGPAPGPPWLGDENLHRSHQSNLIRKDPAIYAVRFPGVPDDLPYVWPVTSSPAVV